MATPTLLIAGATGTNGQEILKQLDAANIPALALVRDVNRAKHLASDNIRLVQGDLSDEQSLVAAMQGVEKAFVVSAIVEDTVQWFNNFYSSAKQAGVKHVVKFSGLGADINSASEIIRQHAISDQALMASGLTYTILRPNSFFQNMFWQVESIKHAGQFYLPLANAQQSLVDVRDLAEVAVKALTEQGHENKVYNLTGSESLSFNDVAKIVTEEIGKETTYIAVPPEAAEQSMLDQGFPQWNAHALVEIQSVFATNKYATPEPDLANILGREPRTFRQFMQDHLAVFRD